jgi:glycosyltransferase involved in cell wall biosynthesis
MGHKVTLFLMEEQDNFLPENDLYGNADNIEIVELPWKHKQLYKTSSREIKKHLEGFDFYCASEFAPAFLFKAGIKADVFVPIGSDLIQYPFQKLSKTIPPVWEIDEYQFHLFQRAGIRNAGCTFINKNGDMQLENALEKIGFLGRRFPVSLPYLYIPESEKQIAESPFEEKITEIRKKAEILIISHGRCEFTVKDSIHNKGTDILLRGMYDFIKKEQVNIQLVLIEYGSDVKATKELIKELELENNIHWLPKCGRKDIFPILHYFDLSIGNLYYSNWSYNVAMESVAAKLPFVRKGVENDNIAEDRYPYIAAENALSLSKIFNEFHKNPGHFINIGLKAFDWYKSHGVEKPLNLLKDFLALTSPAKGRFQFSREKANWILLNNIVRPLSWLRMAFKTRLAFK